MTDRAKNMKINNVKITRWLSVVLILLTWQSCKKDNGFQQYQSLNEEIDALADQYVKVGAVIGVIDKGQNKHFFSYGSKTVDNSESPDANTVFDIGSITKSFTAIIAAEMTFKGKISDEYIGHYLPADKVIMPSLNGTEITFKNLLTHTSGLPRTPHENDSTFPKPPGYDIENPYAAYTTNHIYDYLTNYCNLLFTPGTGWEYSNTGVALAGHVLGLIDSSLYEIVLKREIFGILGMNNSSLFLTEIQQENIAPGHDRNKKVVPFYTANDIFQGCGMIKSTMNDMFKFLEANMGLVNSPLSEAMEITHEPVIETVSGPLGLNGMGWFITDLDDGQQIIYNGGDTNGHSAFIGFNKSELTGAIILLNYSKHDGTNISMGKEIMEAILKY